MTLIAGQLLAVTDPLDRVTTYQYDGLGRQVSQTMPDPDGQGGDDPAQHATVYDAAGRAVETIDPLGHETTGDSGFRGHAPILTIWRRFCRFLAWPGWRDWSFQVCRIT